MVVNMADFCKCRESVQTPSYMIANEFLSAYGIVRVDFRWICKGPKLADFDLCDVNVRLSSHIHPPKGLGEFV